MESSARPAVDGLGQARHRARIHQTSSRCREGAPRKTTGVVEACQQTPTQNAQRTCASARRPPLPQSTAEVAFCRLRASAAIPPS